MKITYLGHSAFLIETKEFKALIDPFISGNPNSNISVNDLKEIDYIFVTHGHGDHLGDTIDIAKKCNSKVICNFEIGFHLQKMDVNVHTMHIGGKTAFEFFNVKLTPALHGSDIIYGGNILPGGNPCGFLIKTDGKTIYHAGDTGLTMDMKLLADENIDIAMLPIGGNYTMDIDDAIKAQDFIQAKSIIPMHYNTFDLIKADPNEFSAKVKNCNVVILNPGESKEL